MGKSNAIKLTLAIVLLVAAVAVFGYFSGWFGSGAPKGANTGDTPVEVPEGEYKGGGGMLAPDN
jgi:flagellar basal body-associated protein FliL